jgi:hypothetical protein
VEPTQSRRDHATRPRPRRSPAWPRWEPILNEDRSRPRHLAEPLLTAGQRTTQPDLHHRCLVRSASVRRIPQSVAAARQLPFG